MTTFFAIEMAYCIQDRFFQEDAFFCEPLTDKMSNKKKKKLNIITLDSVFENPSMNFKIRILAN